MIFKKQTDKQTNKAHTHTQPPPTKPTSAQKLWKRGVRKMSKKNPADTNKGRREGQKRRKKRGVLGAGTEVPLQPMEDHIRADNQ